MRMFVAFTSAARIQESFYLFLKILTSHLLFVIKFFFKKKSEYLILCMCVREKEKWDGGYLIPQLFFMRSSSQIFNWKKSKNNLILSEKKSIIYG